MKIAIVGANGSIGGVIMHHIFQRSDVTKVVAITRKPLANSSADQRFQNAVIPDFSDLDSIPEETWTHIQDVDALIWAMGSYTYDADVNLNYPLTFQSALLKRFESRKRDKTTKFRFILLGGAFTETDQSRGLFFLPGQRRMKGLLQTQTLQFAESSKSDINWTAHIIRPAGVLMGGDTYLNRVASYTFGTSLTVKGEELGAFVADLAVNGSERSVVENGEIAEGGRRLIASS